MGKRIFLVSMALMFGALVWMLYYKWVNEPEYIVLANPRGVCVSVDELRRGELYQKHTSREVMLSVSTAEWGSYERAWVSHEVK